MDSQNCVKGLQRLAALLAFFASLFSPQRAAAQFTFASDNATSYTTATWTNGSDLGSGFGGWGITIGTGSGTFVGSPSGDGMGTNGIGTSAFAFYANDTGYVNASRGFDAAMGIGDTFSFYWAINWDAAAGNKGFDLKSGGTTIFNVNNGGSENITTTGGGTITGFGTTPMLVTLTRTAMGTYSFTMTSRSGGSTFSTNISSSSAIDNFSFYAGNQVPSSGNRNMYFNVFSITNSGVFSQGGSVTNANTFSGSGALSVGNNTTLVLSGGGNNNYTGATTISNGSTLVFAGSGTSQFASTIGGAGGSVLMSNASGTVVLTNDNTYTGNTTVAAGALLIGHANALGSTGTLTVGTTGQLQLSNSLSINRAITLSGDGIGFAGALRNMSGINSWQGTISNAAGARINAESGSVLTLSNINSGTNNLYLGGAGNITIGGLIAGTQTAGNGAIYKDGSGVLTLSANNSGLSGLVRLLGGTVSITNNNSLGSGILELGGLGTQAILSVGTNTTRSQNLLIQNASTNSVINVAAGSAFTVTGSLTQDGALTNTTKFGKLGSGTLILAGISGNTYNGQIQIGQGTVIAGTASALGVNNSTTQRGIDLGLNITDVSQGNNVALLASNGVTISNSFYVSPNTSSALRTIGLAGSGSATFNNEFYMDGILTVDAGSSASDSVAMSGNILNTGGISKTNAGILVLSGSGNTFSGGVTLGQGTLRVGNNSALGTGALTINGGTFASDGATARTITNGITMGGNATLGDATGTGVLTLSNVNLAQATRTLTVANNTTIVGVISNGGATAAGLTKAGSGTLTLSGANTYSGGTLVSGGRLVGDTRSLQGVITNNAAVTFDQSTNGTYASALSGTGALVKSGSGSVTFSGANTYSGGTLVAGGTLIGDTRSLQGAITNTAAVVFNQSTNGSYTGLMSGSGGTFTKSGTGTVTLSANNSYTGATTVGGGRLVVNGSQGSSAVTVNSGASLGGSGTVGALTVSGLVAPGNSIGTLSAGNTVFNGGGSFELEIFDWVSTAGTGWDLLAITGNLTLSNTSGSPFAINLVSLQDSSTPGLSTDWNQNVNFTNTFITYSGSLLGTTFATNLFSINTSGFQNPVNGTFSITNVSGGLALLYTTSFSPSAAYNWNAGSGLWGTAGNWTNGATPTNGASIIFSGAGGASTNSSTVSSIQSLVFTNAAGAYTVSGTALAVGAGGISNASTSAQTISNNLSLSANAAVTAEAGNIVLAGNLTNGGNAVTVGGAANTTISGVISGSGTLTKSGAGSLSLANANSYTGATTISGGTVVASENTSLGTTNAGTTVNSGATLGLSGGITTAESITIAGGGVGDGGAIRSLGDGENTISGNITLGGNARINVDAPTGSVTSLASLGSANFAVSSEFSLIPYTQTSTNITLTSATAGDTLAGQFGSIYDWSSVSSFGLRMRVAGTNPDLPFEVIFYNGAFEELERYEASTVGLTSTASVKTLDLLGTSQPLSSVEWMEFKWNSSAATTSVSLFDVVSIPTSGLVVSGNVNAGTNVLTVGSAAGGTGTVADGVTFSGVISGAGGTYNGTATTLVKDGGGVLNLLGNNTFTGDVRILDGILRILFGSSTNALGVGSDLFISSLGTLELSGDVSVSSFQGAGAGDAGNVALSSSAILTVNGANKTMTMAGNITGDGGLRLAGNASTVLTLTGNNTFIDNTAVVSGTLELAGTGGNQALASTGPVIVSSGAKLLLSTSNQVRDFAAVTLSGGTIQRGSGVSEVFGNLNIAGGSTLDFGLGAIGQLQFQSYSYTGSALVEVQNFRGGNRLQFLSTSFSSANLSQFDFNGIGYSTGIEGSYFTITAIPEPSTYLAAGGLIGLMLWSGRRRLASFALRRREDI